MQEYDPNGNDIGFIYIIFQNDDLFVAVGSESRAKPGGMSHAKIRASLGRERARDMSVDRRRFQQLSKRRRQARKSAAVVTRGSSGKCFRFPVINFALTCFATS